MKVINQDEGDTVVKKVSYFIASSTNITLGTSSKSIKSLEHYLLTLLSCRCCWFWIGIYPTSNEHVADFQHPFVCWDEVTCINKDYFHFILQHHCRKCGRAVCKTCSNQTSVLPSFGYEFPVRLCQECHFDTTEDEWVKSFSPILQSFS